MKIHEGEETIISETPEFNKKQDTMPDSQTEVYDAFIVPTDAMYSNIKVCQLHLVAVF